MTATRDELESRIIMMQSTIDHLNFDNERLWHKTNDHDSAAQAAKERASFLQTELDRVTEERNTFERMLKMWLHDPNLEMEKQVRKLTYENDRLKQAIENLEIMLAQK